MNICLLERAKRVEYAVNLLGHPGRKIAGCLVVELELSIEEVCQPACAPLLAASSTRAGLDISQYIEALIQAKQQDSPA